MSSARGLVGADEAHGAAGDSWWPSCLTMPGHVRGTRRGSRGCGGGGGSSLAKQRGDSGGSLTKQRRGRAGPRAGGRHAGARSTSFENDTASDETGRARSWCRWGHGLCINHKCPWALWTLIDHKGPLGAVRGGCVDWRIHKAASAHISQGTAAWIGGCCRIDARAPDVFAEC